MSHPPIAVKPKKTKTAIVLGCDQCRRRKTKCDQARPTCGPCLHAGLMECTFLLGKAPPPKRKKAHSEVEILEARLETIESAYSERLSQMESLLNRVMPEGQFQDLMRSGTGLSTTITTAAPTGLTTGSNERQETISTNDGDWRDTESSPEGSRLLDSSLDQHAISDVASAPFSPSIPSTIPNNDNSIFSGPKKEAHESGSNPPDNELPDFSQDEDDSDDGDLGELTVTMDKLRLFDASLYFGKGTMLFTSTDKNTFWDEEITFDVHDPLDIDIPPEAFVMPPVDVIDELFDIYYKSFYAFLPMVQKVTLLRALEDRYEPQSIFLLNSVFMIAALTGDCKHSCCYVNPDDPKTLSTPFFERARLVLDYCIGIPRVSTVQGLILLSRYPKITGLGQHYVQQAILMASDMGLHRKCDRWIPDKEVQETRKRVFWCVYMVDSNMASATGRRPLLDDNEIDVPLVLPTATEGEEEYSNTLFLVQMCKLWHIFRDVKQYVFNAVEVQDMVPGSLPKKYEQQLIQWQLQLPAALRFSFDIKLNDPGAMHNARGGVVQMLYESTLILLHKPYITSSEHLRRSPYRSQDICIKAASKITEIGRVLSNTYERIFETVGAAEYSLTNAIRIHVMYMRSSDPKIAELSQKNFDYVARFFREFYSVPRGMDDQTINCILSFFDEFMHVVNGLSESTVHICASAIKSMAIAKRSKIELGRLTGGNRGKKSASEREENRNLSRLVKIGREERAKARLNAMSSPSTSTQDSFGAYRKRQSHLQHGSQRVPPSQHLQQNQFHHPESISSSVSSHTSIQDTTMAYRHPGKIQKVSQYVGPFGGPLVIESLNQYQTSTAILSQPHSNSAIPLSIGSPIQAGEVFDTLNQQQQQQQQQHFISQVSSPQQALLMSMHRLQQPQQQQRLFPQVSQSLSHNDTLTPQFWGVFPSINTTQGGLDSNMLGGGTSTTFGASSSSVPETIDLTGTLEGSNNVQETITTSIFNTNQQHRIVSQDDLFATVKGNVGDSNPIEGVEEELSADQIQALLEQTLAEDTRNNHNNSINSLNPPAPFHHLGQLDHIQTQRIEQSGSREDFNLTNWHTLV
ncbi:Transcriptional activator of fatty acid utilization [Entomortierella beljakovae]|nr:Transcriptional activator of fatty acid utilization [Entomortierella beljakovae]